jgi:hypothetical protein
MSYQSLNQTLDGERCEILLANIGLVIAENIKLTEDSTYIVTSVGTIKTPTSNILRINCMDNGQGALEGAGIGALVGLFYSIVLTPEAEKDQNAFGANMLRFFGRAALFTGPLYGLGIGAIIGHKDNYIFTDSEDSADNLIEKRQAQALSIEDKSPVRVIFSSVVEKGIGYITILWQGEEIRLQRSEYNYRGTTAEGQQFIVVPNYIFESKFK